MSIRCEDKIVKYCRFVFFSNKEYFYNKHWIDTKKLEFLEVKNNLSHIEVDLYPRHVVLDEELRKLGITPPPRFTEKIPKKPNKLLLLSKEITEYEYNELKKRKKNGD